MEVINKNHSGLDHLSPTSAGVQNILTAPPSQHKWDTSSRLWVKYKSLFFFFCFTSKHKASFKWKVFLFFFYLSCFVARRLLLWYLERVAGLQDHPSIRTVLALLGFTFFLDFTVNNIWVSLVFFGSATSELTDRVSCGVVAKPDGYNMIFTCWGYFRCT